MKHLRVDAKALGADGFRLELASKTGQTDVLELGPSSELTGTYEQSAEHVWLRQIAATRLDVQALGWALPAGRGELMAPGLLEDAVIDAAIALGPQAPPQRFRGSVRAAEARADATVALAGARARCEGLRLQQARWAVDGTGEQSLQATRVEIEALELDLDDYAVTLRGLVLTDVSFDGRYLQVGAMTLQEVAVASRESPTGASVAAPEGASRPRALDLPFLDLLSGSVNADVRTDMTVPILGRRRATHRFRIEVDDGTIDFRAVERNLSLLEDLVVQVKHRDDRLVIEKDIKLIPFDRETLVWWDLDADARALASDRRVKLRTLLSPKLPEKQRAELEKDIEKRGKAVALRQLAVDDIDVTLRLGGPSSMNIGGGSVALGTAEEPALQKVTVRGALHHDAGGDAEAGRLSLSAIGLLAALDGVALGAWATSIKRLAVGRVDSIELEMRGFEVARYRVAATNVSLVGLHARGVPAPAAPRSGAPSAAADPPTSEASRDVPEREPSQTG